MKPECTLQHCLWIAKLTEGTVHVEKLGQNFLANVDKHSQNVDAVNRGRPRSKGPHGFKGNHKVVVTTKVMVELKVIVKEKVLAETVEPVTCLDNVLPMERSVTTVV